MKYLAILFSVAAAAAAGFIVAPYISPSQQADANDTNIFSKCAIVASENVRGDEIRIRCGLDEDGIDGILRNALAELGIEDLREGELDADAMQHAAEELGLTMKALTALLGDQREDSQQTTTGQPSQDREDQIRVAVEVDPGGTSSDETGQEADQKEPKTKLHERIALAIEPPVTAPEEDARQIAAECGVASGGSVDVDLVDLECGPEEAEITGLLDELVEKAGVSEIQDILNKDAEARSRFVSELGDALKLSDETVEQLLAELEQVEVSDGELRRRLSETMSNRIRLSLTILQMGQMAELLRSNQQQAAKAIVDGKLEEARDGMVSVGETMRPLADRLAPQTLPELAVASNLALEATELVTKESFGEAAFIYDQAAIAAENGGWPVIGQVYQLMSATMASAAGERSGDGEMTQYAIDTQLSVAKGFSDLALDTALNAADALRDHGRNDMDSSALNRGLQLLQQVAPQIDRSTNPRRFVSLQSGLAGVLWRLGQRSVDSSHLVDAASASQLALEAAEEIGDSWSTAQVLIDWGNVRSELGTRTRDLQMIDESIGAYERASELFDPEQDLENWLTAQTNTAVAYTRKSRIERNPSALDDAAKTYRNVLKRVDKDNHGDLWALTTNNLAGILWSQGHEKGDDRVLRQAAESFEESLTYYTREAAPFAWARGMNNIGQIWKDIGEIKEDDAAFEKAAATIEQVISAYDRETTARPWASAQTDLGNVYYAWGRLDANTERLQMAIDAYDEARAVISADIDPTFHGRLLLYKSYASLETAIETKNQSSFDDAQEAAEESLEILKESKGNRVDAELDRLIKDGAELLAEIKREARR